MPLSNYLQKKLLDPGASAAGYPLVVADRLRDLVRQATA